MPEHGDEGATTEGLATLKHKEGLLQGAVVTNELEAGHCTGAEGNSRHKEGGTLPKRVCLAGQQHDGCVQVVSSKGDGRHSKGVGSKGLPCEFTCPKEAGEGEAEGGTEHVAVMLGGADCGESANELSQEW